MLLHESMPMPSRYWADHTSESIAAMDRERVVALLPLAATEQHGPHLPLSTDTLIAEGLVRATVARLPEALPLLVLPTVSVGKSNEHARYPGTLTLSLATLMSLWGEIAAGVVASGIKRLVLFNSHGGQANAMDIAVRDLRERHGILTVAVSWGALGLPAGLFDEHEVRHGIHGGAIETSLVLALAPQLVRTERLQRFGSLTETLERENQYLSITPRGKIGWQTQDLSPLGACGDASAASAAKGVALIEHTSARLAELLAEVHAYDLARLAQAPAWR